MILAKEIGKTVDNSGWGGKATNLNILTRSGINVPPGIVFPSHVYQEYLKQNTILDQIKQDLMDYVTSHPSNGYMVRSSALGEDGVEHSFAGQLDSFICTNCVDEILEKIQTCWDSLQTDRVKVYQTTHNVSLKGIAVIVQELISPDFSGVLFTTSHLDENEMLVEFVAGHGEKLVQGEVTPESLSIPKNTSDLPAAPFSVKQLINAAHEILSVYHYIPQDIEWASYKDNIYIVQSRPITTIKEKIKWSNTNVNENYPEKLSPMLYSIARRSYYHYFKNLALDLGVIERKTVDSDEYFSNIIGLWGHRMYYNMTSIHNVLALTPIKNLFKASFDDFVGYQKVNETAERKRSKSILVFGIRLIKEFFSLPSKVSFIEKTVSDYSKLQKEASTISDFNRIHHQFLNIRVNKWIFASYADLFAMLTHGLLGKFTHNIDSKNAMGLQNGLIQAIPGLVSNQPIFRNWDIVLKINQLGLKDWFISTDSHLVWQELESGRTPELYNDIKAYLDDFGFRCSGELTLFLENYIEKPESFISMLQLYIKTTEVDPRKLFGQKHKEQQQLLKDTLRNISATTKNPVTAFLKKQTLRLLVRLTCYAISCRERVRLKQALLYHHFKQNLKAVASYFELLETDIYYLEYDEVSRIVAGDPFDKKYIQKLIALRKEKLKNEQPAPDNFYTLREDLSYQLYNQDTLLNLEGVLKGLPACAGVIKAPVKVLESVHELAKLEKGDILVTKQTDPGWIYAFPLISGLIVERGGMLSHGAIVAREFGIPAVVGVSNITSILSDGQIVTVDGTQGIIQC